MIEFQNLYIQNFLSIGKAAVALRDRGLVLIEGENLDDPSAKSNGAGKSSIVDAISWCLYGVTAKGVRADSVVNLKVGKDCCVKIVVRVDKALYEITRYRKDTSGMRNNLTLVEVDGGIRTHHTAGTDKLTQQRIESLLGCDAETFNASIYMGQESMVDLPSLTDKSLKQVLQSAMGLDRLDHAAMLADAALSDGYRMVETAGRSVDTQLDLINASEKLQSTIEGTIEVSRRTIEAEQKILDESRDDYVRKSEENETDGKAIKSKLTRLAAFQAKAVEAHREAKSAAVWDEAGLLDALNKAQAARDTALRNINAAEHDLALLRKAQDDGICHACKRPHDMATDHTAAIKILASDIKVLVSDLETAKTNFADARAKLHGERAKAEAVTAKAKEDCDKVAMAIMAAKSELQAHERYAGKYEQDTEDRLTKMENFIARLHHTMMEEVRKSGQQHDLLSNLRVELRRKEETLKLARSKMQPLENAAHALSRKGFRGEVFDQITPYLNARTQYYLDTLTEGNIAATWVTIQEDAHGNYQEKFHIEINHKSGVDQFAMLSGGEKRKVRLACALALQDLVATRAIKPIRLFVADEIDDAIDDAGLELLMGVLEQKARDVGSVFIISHNPISDMVRNHIVIQKQDGISTIKNPE